MTMTTVRKVLLMCWWCSWSLSISLGQSLPDCENNATLQTTFGGFLANSIMFDVSTTMTDGGNGDTSPLWITSLEASIRAVFLQSGPYTVNVMTKEGTHVGFENDISAWTLLHSERDVTSSDLLCAICTDNRLESLLRLDFDVPVALTNTRAFYLSVSGADSDDKMVVFGDGRATPEPGAVVVQDDYLVIQEGTPLPSYFGLSVEKDNATTTLPPIANGGFFSGKINYFTPCDMAPPPMETLSCPTNQEATTVTLPTADTVQSRTHGVMWDLTAAGDQDILVSELQIPIDAKAATFDFDILQLWTKEGSLVGFESDPNAWTIVVAQSVDYPSSTLSFSSFWSLPVGPFLIPAGETRAFYVTTFGDEEENFNFLISGVGRQDEAINVDLGPLTAFDANVEINNAMGLGSFFLRGTDSNKVLGFWNGIVVYDVCTPSSSNSLPPETTCPETYNTKEQIVSLGLEEATRIIKFDAVFAIDVYVETLFLALRENIYSGDFVVSVWTTNGLLDQVDADVSTWDIVYRSSITIEDSFFISLPEDRFRRISVQAGQPLSFAVGFLLLDDETPLYAGGGIRPGEWAVRTPDLLVRESGSVFSGAVRYSSCNRPRRFMPQCGDDSVIQAVTTVPPSFNPQNLLVASGPQGGVMFDIQASESIEVSSIDTRLTDPTNFGSASGVVSVWTKTGSYVGFEDEQSAWELLFRHEVRFSNYEDLYEDLPRGLNAIIPVDVFRPKVIPAGSTQAFYVTMHADTVGANVIALPVNGPPGTLIGDDGTVQIYSGLALSEQFGGTLSGRNGFFGYINYRRCPAMSSQQAFEAASNPDRFGPTLLDSSPLDPDLTSPEGSESQGNNGEGSGGQPQFSSASVVESRLQVPVALLLAFSFLVWP